MKIDASAMIDRATGAIRRHGARFGLGGEAGRADAPDPRPVLMWLAGAGYRPKEIARHKGMVPVPRGDEEAADRILAADRPDDPVLAARMRADMLVALRREASDDPRAKEIFEADPVIAADPATGWLVTASMLDARIGLFDLLNTLIGKPYLADAARTALRTTLAAAFRDLPPDSQREWCHSEARLEQGLAFLESRDPDDLTALADTLRPVGAARGVWDAMRLFALAVRMGDARGERTAPVAPLLAPEDARRAA